MTVQSCRGAAALAAAFMVACSDAPVQSTGPTNIVRDTTALFQTDSLAYALIHRDGTYNMVVDATLTNRTSGPIYISNCAGATGIYLEKQTAAGWTIVRSPILPACLSPPIVIAIGATYTFNVNLAGGDSGSTRFAPQYRVTDLNGEYRLLWDGAFSSYDQNSGTGAPLTENWRVSNHFLVRAVER